MIEIKTEIGTENVIERGGVNGRGRGNVRSDHGAAAGTGKGGGGGAGAGKEEEGRGGEEKGALLWSLTSCSESETEAVIIPTSFFGGGGNLFGVLYLMSYTEKTSQSVLQMRWLRLCIIATLTTLLK